MPEADKDQTRILIIDDEPAIRDLLREYLNESYQCAEAGSAECALELLRSERFDLVLSDIQMGGISGLEMVPRLLELAPDTVVVMVSGISTIESAIEAMRVGAFDYVTKPFNFTQVGAAVRRALEHRALREANRQAEGRFRQIVEHATDIIYRTDVKGHFTLVNPVAARFLKRPAKEFVGLHYLELVRPDYRGEAEKFYGSQFAGRVADTYFEFPALAGDGGEVWLGQNVRLLVEGDRIVGFQAVARDITRQRFYDAATGLPNRAHFEAEAAKSLSSAGQGRWARAVMLISPDRFKRFVDTLGHAAGDRLLRGVAERLKGCVGDGDLLARFGDEEFALLPARTGRAEEIIPVARRIHEALKHPFSLDGHDLYVTASVGIALAPGDGQDAPALTKNAGAALFRAKEEGGNNHQFYAAEMNARALRRLSLESGLRRGLEREEFTLHYQPQADIFTNTVTGMEALVRWQHPEMGLVSPGEFIPLAEDTGLIVALDEWVLRTACAQNKAWQAAGLPHLRVSTNVSARMFRQPGLSELVSRVLEETGLDPDCLDLELTESSVMSDAEAAAETLRSLRELGVHVSIDDFGTGYSSLSYLKKFPADCLKIDQSFVRDAATEPNDAAIVRAVITLARSLGLKVIAEGVETEEQLRFLRLLGCDEVQGYLLSRPLPAEEFRRKALDGGGQITRGLMPRNDSGHPTPSTGETDADRKIREALGLYRTLAEEMKYSTFAMQTLAESCDPRTADELRRFVALCRRTRSTKSSEEGRAVREALKRADRAR
ncbi:MAG: EAL domain-containing protein [Acidobacteriota bacterium]|nr:EAL domain-containing protein [Acidobacteriota bacterium]MDQ5836717.1 EAL domain-containing protein [Acidobacteriota bacterium]